MPPRPAQRQLASHSANRLSAVYIGPNPYPASPRSPPNNPDIPDLPEPPSPSTSSTGSGLPSPPATNSTGSGNGSTGDQNSIAIRGKDRPLSVSLNSSSSSSTGTASAGGVKDATFYRKPESIGSTASASASTSTLQHTDGHDQDHDNRDDDDSHNDGLLGNHEELDDVDGDDTARLDLRQPPNENVLALQRVRSLAERNRMVLDKLSSYPRTGSPLSMSSTSRSTGPSTAKSTSRLSYQDPHSLSGSETERECEYEPQSNTSPNAGASTQHLRSLSHTHARTPPSPGPARTRHPSAPSSPLKALSISRSISTETGAGSSSSASQSTKHSYSHSVHSNGAMSTSSNGSSPSKRRKRVSLAMTSHLAQFVDGRDGGGREWDRDRDRDSGRVWEREEPIRAKTSMAFVSPSERERERERASLSLSGRTGSGSGSGSGSAGAKRRAALPFEFRNGPRIPTDTDQDPEPMTHYRIHSHAYNSNSNSNGSRRGKWASEDMQFAAPGPALSVASSSSRSGVGSSEWRRSGGGGSERRSVAGGSDHRSVGGSTSDWRSVGGGSEYRSVGGSEHWNGGGSESIIRRRASPVTMGMREYRERRQSLRGGSAESALATHNGTSGYGGSETVGGVGRSLVGEEFKAAGLSPTKRRYAGRGGGSGSLDLDVDTGKRRGGDGDGDVFVDGDVGRPRTSGGGGPKTRVGAGDVMTTPRAATSMADYRYLGRYDEEFEEEQMERSRRLRQARSALPLGEGSLRREGSLSRARETSLVRERETSLVRERETSLARERETSLAREREMDRDRDKARDFDRDRDRSVSSMSRYEPVRHQPTGERYASPFGSRRYNPVVSLPSASITSSTTAIVPHPHAHQEHTRLMLESLGMFEGHLARLGPILSASGSGSGTNTPGGGPGCGSTASELLRTAQTVVGAAERLNAMMRYGTTHAMEQQVDAEVEGGEQRGDVVEMWREVGGEFRDAQRVSDDLVRGLTGFLLGIGKVVREFAAGGGSGCGGGGGGGESQHLRSMSLDEEGLRRARGSLSPDVVIGGGAGSGAGSTGGGSGSGRRSVESRRSWEISRDDLSRKVMSRGDTAAAAQPQAFRDKDRSEGRYETPPSAALRTSIGTRRLFTPREQREEQLVAGPSTGGPNRMVASDSQETIYASYEPSPTPASRNQTALERSRTLPALGLPKPIPTLPSESLLRRNQSVTDKYIPPGAVRDRDRERRQASVTSIASVATLRGNSSHPNPHFPASLTTPSNATTALTPHTVSTHTPDRGTFPVLPRTDPDQPPRSAVAFSRPSTVSVSALNGLQQQHLEHERRRTLSSGSAGAEPSTSVPPNRVQQSQVMSGSETERDTRRRTMGRVGRVSLDGMEGAGSGTSRKAAVQAADRSAPVVGLGSGGKLPSVNGSRRERRRTVTEIWPKG